MYMLISTRNKELVKSRTLVTESEKLTENRKQQIYLLEQKVKNLEEQLKLCNMIKDTKGANIKAPKKGDISYNTDNASYSNVTANITDDTIYALNSLSTYEKHAEHSTPSSSSSSYDSYSSHGSSHSSSCDSSSSSSSCSSD